MRIPPSLPFLSATLALIGGVSIGAASLASQPAMAGDDEAEVFAAPGEAGVAQGDNSEGSHPDDWVVEIVGSTTVPEGDYCNYYTVVTHADTSAIPDHYQWFEDSTPVGSDYGYYLLETGFEPWSVTLGVTIWNEGGPPLAVDYLYNISADEYTSWCY